MIVDPESLIEDEEEEEEDELDDHETFNPPVLAIEYLRSLGFKVNDVGLVNESIGLKILEVKREDDGTPADFAFASNMQCTAGVVLPHPIQHYIAWIDENEESEELGSYQ